MNISDISNNWNTAGGVDSMSGASSYVASADSSLTTMRGSVQQQSQNFKALQSALQTGDLSGAQSAYATLQQQIQKASQTAGQSLFDPNGAIGKDFQAIGTALQSGNVSDAQSAFASFRQDMRAARHQRHNTTPTIPDNTGTSSNSSLIAGASSLDVVA